MKNITDNQFILRSIAGEFLAGRTPPGLEPVIVEQFGEKEWIEAKEFVKSAPVVEVDTPTGKQRFIEITRGV
jgi:hypothetical protein